jgi:transcriptional regulator with XRE-family HTH domain
VRGFYAMKEENKGFFDSEKFVERIEETMQVKNISYEQLHQILTEKVGYSITKNNLRIYIQNRTPNIQFAIALSKALDVSMDFLFGTDSDEKTLYKGINYHLLSKRYQKYIGDYHLYFYNTRSNSVGSIIHANLSVRLTTKYEVSMEIATTEGGIKKYKGQLLISDLTPTVYMLLYAEFGEVVSMTFYDEAVNFNKFRCAVGAMLSVSSGDLKRSPVMNRFVLTDYEVTEEKKIFLEAHLRMNTKYINIKPKKLRDVLSNLIDENAEDILKRLSNAFSEQSYFSIEESFIENTIKNDYDLSSEEVERLIAELRNNSLAPANSKVNRSLDTKLFMSTKQN